MNRTILKNIKTAILHSSKTEKEVWEYLDLSQEQWKRIFRGKEDLRSEEHTLTPVTIESRMPSSA